MPDALSRGLGWLPSIPDIRDRPFRVSRETLETLPPSVDLRPEMPPVFDQGQLGSCTSQAICAALQFDAMKQQEPDTPLSRLMLYYLERDCDGDVGYDSGSSIRTGMKVVNQTGVCAESLWPYDIGRFTEKPPDTAYADAPHHQAIEYAAVDQTEEQVKAALALGYPVVFGFTVYESFEEHTGNTGLLDIPSPSESVRGGHAVFTCGYDDATRYYIGRNSWGASWGRDGYFFISYDYLLNPNLADDFWVVRRVT